MASRTATPVVWLKGGAEKPERRAEPRDNHTHGVWTLEGGCELRFVDARRIGLVRAAPALGA